MNGTKKLAISAMSVALGVVIMSAGALLEMMDLTVCAVASLLVVLIYIELGSPYTWLVWLATSLATAIMFFGSMVWVEYFLVFGVYPIIKAYFEKLPRVFWIPIKLIYINITVLALFLCSEFLFGLPFFETDLTILKIALIVLINVSFIVYDLFVTAMVRVYLFKWRKHFARFFK